MQAEMIIGAINAGVFALGFWTFCDYPDPINGPSYCDDYMKMWSRYEPYMGGGINHRYNRWGLLPFENHFGEIPRPVYWCIAPIVKYLKRNSQILEVQTDSELVHACAIHTRNDRISIIVSSRLNNEEAVTIQLPKSGKESFRVYRYLESNPPINQFGDLQAPSETIIFKDSSLKLSMPAKSVMIITNDFEEKNNSVCAEIISCDNSALKWKPVSDKNHCYYRVFAVEGNVEKQIASTVDCHCNIQDSNLNYRIYSVDRFGNV